MADSYSVLAFPGDGIASQYRGLVFAKWLRSLRYGNDYFRLIDSQSYYPTYQRFIKALLSYPDCLVRVAVLSDDYDVALGFSVSRGTILDFVYVQKDQRKNGIGTKLLPGSIQKITHLTKDGLSWWANKHSEWKFDPFA